MEGNQLTEKELIDRQLDIDLKLYGQSYEYLIDGKRYRLDPRFVKRTFLTNEIKGGKSPVKEWVPDWIPLFRGRGEEVGTLKKECDPKHV